MRKFICTECGYPKPCVFYCQYDDLVSTSELDCPMRTNFRRFIETDDTGEPVK